MTALSGTLLVPIDIVSPFGCTYPACAFERGALLILTSTAVAAHQQHMFVGDLIVFSAKSVKSLAKFFLWYEEGQPSTGLPHTQQQKLPNKFQFGLFNERQVLTIALNCRFGCNRPLNCRFGCNRPRVCVGRCLWPWSALTQSKPQCPDLSQLHRQTYH